MTKAATKLAQTLGIARIARQAHTTSDYEKLADALRADLHAETAALADLHKQRETLLIDGGDEGAFYDRIARAHEREKTLRANLLAVERRRDERQAIERTEELEAAAREARKRDLPELMARLRDLHAKGLAFVEAGESVQALQCAIAAHDENAKGQGRRDLVVGVSTTRERLAREMADFAPQEPLPQMAGEPDAAFALRIQNHASKELYRLAERNPFLLIAAAIRETLESVVVPRDAHEASRNQVVTNVEHFVDVYGQARTKIRSLAATGKIGKGLLEPLPSVETSPAEYSPDFVQKAAHVESDASYRGGR